MTGLAAILLATTLAASGDHDVVPGERIGKIRIGMTADEVHAALGRPNGSAVRRRDGLREEWWFGGKHESQTVRVWFERGSAVQVSATAPAFRTKEGLSTSSGVPAILRLALKRSGYEHRGSGGGFGYYYDDVARGIGWEIWGPATPQRDEPQFHVYAVFVHVRNRPVAVHDDLIDGDLDETCTPETPQRCGE